MADERGKTVEEAIVDYNARFAEINWGGDWVAQAVQSTCVCGFPKLTAVFTSEALGSKVSIRLSHSSKQDGLFYNIEERWEKFKADNLERILSRLPKMEAGRDGTFAEIGMTVLPGVGFAITFGGLDDLIRSIFEQGGDIPE